VNRFEFLLFSTQACLIQAAVQAGVDGVIVDWERQGKAQRQAGADTQINQDTLEDLQRVRRVTQAQVICRLNRQANRSDEIHQALDAGADEIMLPMVETPAEVEAILGIVAGRCQVSILVETVSALRHAPELGQLPLRRVYVGLNDLSIQRHTPNIFTPLVDGTIEAIRPHFPMPFGFGGLTLPECGKPIPCRLLIAEMIRLDCQFSFLRRSFHRDIQGRHPQIEIPRLRQALQQARQRSAHQVEADRSELQRAIKAWNPELTAGEGYPR
jgi:hypothetical protein